MDIYYYYNSLSEERSLGMLALENESLARVLNFKGRRNDSKLSVENCPLGGMVTPTCKQAMWPVPHDYIGLQISNYRQSESEVVVLYKKGLSLRDIEKRCGYSKTKVRDVLIRSKIPLRNLAGGTRRAVQGTSAKKNAKPPYGFCYFEGRVVVHPKEYPYLLAIIGRWQSAQSLNSIATWLNEKRVPSPMGKSWSWNSVSNIILRIKTGHLIESGDHYELR